MPIDDTDPKFIVPAEVEGDIHVLNKTTGQSAFVPKNKGDETWVVFDTSDPDTPEPPPAGEYGDGWPKIPDNANTAALANGGNNNYGFGSASVVSLRQFSNPGNMGLALTDCTGDLYLYRCDFTGSRQGLVTRMTRSDIRAPRVFCIECLFADNYVDGLVGLPAELATYYHTKMGTGFFGLYGCTFINSGWTGKDRDKGTDPTEYDHDVYTKGDIELEAMDCLSIRPSSQFHKGMGRSFVAKRNAILEPAIGMGCGQERENTLRPSDPLSRAVLQGNLVYGARDLPASNQRLGWGVAVQGADLIAEDNIFCSPNSENQNLPAFRFNECDGLVDRAIIRRNHIYGYKHVVEIDSQTRPYAPDIEIVSNSISFSTDIYKMRRQGSAANVSEVLPSVVADPRITLDVDAIEAKARARQITAADVIAMARAQIGGGA